jgi:hypothetical protein
MLRRSLTLSWRQQWDRRTASMLSAVLRQPQTVRRRRSLAYVGLQRLHTSLVALRGVDTGGWTRETRNGRTQSITVKERNAHVSSTKVLLGLGCFGLFVLAGGMLTCTSCMSSSMNQIHTAPHSAATPATDASFRRLGGQGMMHFVLISQKLSRDKPALAFRVRNFCDQERPGPEWCGVMLWVRESRMAKKLPMSDRQQRAQFATESSYGV